jgi:hypothetical protein
MEPIQKMKQKIEENTEPGQATLDQLFWVASSLEALIFDHLRTQQRS